MDTKSQILSYLEKRTGAQNRRTKLNDTTLLLEEKIIDSIGMLELMAFVEETFGIEVPDADISPDHFGTVSRLGSYIDKKKG